jgi:hypothetical protein
MTDDWEIEVFDTQKTHPYGFTRIRISMTRTISKDEKRPSWMPQYRPNVVVTTVNEGNGMTTTEQFGLKNIDACLIHIGKGVTASFCGHGADSEIMVNNVKRVIGKRSKYNSAENDLNTGRVIIELKEQE